MRLSSAQHVGGDGYQTATLTAPTGVRGTKLGADRSSARDARGLERAPIGARVGRFEIVGVLGEGGMGLVFEAEDPLLDRVVALKLMRSPEAAGGKHARHEQRLVQEARALACISHPNVVPVFDAGVHEGRVYVAMELVDGQTLEEWATRQRRSWRDIVSVFIQAGKGLVAAHREQLVHRDFKPSNVLVGDDGRVRVTDFGLASTADPSPAREESATGAARDEAGARIVGTPSYMAPEQFQGGTIDQRTDQFGFCVALYRCLYRQRPFPGETFAELELSATRRRLADAPAGTSVPPALFKVLERGLRADKSDRFPTMAALLAELARVMRPKRLSRRAAVWTIGLLILAANAGARAGSTPPSASHAEPSDERPGVAPLVRHVAPVPPPTVTLHIDVVPEDAAVSFNGIITPARVLELPRSRDAQELVVRAPGYREHRRRFRPQTSGAIKIELQRAQKPATERAQVTRRARRRAIAGPPRPIRGSRNTEL